MGGAQAKNTCTTSTHSEKDFSYKIVKCEYAWEIEKFKELNYKTGNRLVSEKLKLDIDEQTDEWEIVLYPEGFNKRTANYISVWLRKISTNERLVQFTCEISDHTTKDFVKKTIKKRLSLESELGWAAFCKRSHILENEKLKNGNLTLKCTLQVYDDKCIENPAIEDEDPYMDARLSELSENLKALLQLKKNSDVTFLVESESIQAHKVILSARSPVFRTMFDFASERGKNVISVTDISKEVFKTMLLYLYSGEYTELDFDAVFELFYAADKYELFSLRRICSKILTQNLNTENAVKVIAIANQHSDLILRDAAIEFIAKNATEVQKRKDWLELMTSNPHLVNAIFESLAKLNNKSTK